MGYTYNVCPFFCITKKRSQSYNMMRHATAKCDATCDATQNATQNN